MIDCTSHARLISPYLEESLYRDSSYLLERILHTFDPRMLVMMMRRRRTSGVLGKQVQMVIMTTIVQFSCNLLLPLHCGTLGNRLQEARFPAGRHRLSVEFPVSSAAGNKWSTPDATSVYVSRPPSFQAPDPSFRFQAEGPRLWRPPARPRSKLWRLKASGMS